MHNFNDIFNITEIDRDFFIGSNNFASIKKIIKKEYIPEYVCYLEQDVTYTIIVNQNEYIADIIINGFDILKEWDKRKNYNEKYIINWI